MFGCESHVHQGRTRHRHALIPSGTILVTIHAPKHETFDLVARTNTDPKGIVRAVDVYTVEPWGLYMARPTPGRAQFHYMESWLLPSLGLRATVFHFNPGHERDQDYYLDVGRYTPGATAWHAEDHYLDLVVRTGSGVRADRRRRTADRRPPRPAHPGRRRAGGARRPSPRSTGCPGTTTTSTAGWPTAAWR